MFNRSSLFVLLAAPAAAIAWSAGCASSSVNRGVDDDGGTLFDMDGGVTFRDGGGTIDPGPTTSTVYAHTETTIYTVDPTASGLPLTKVGDVDCILSSSDDKSLTDLAVTEDGSLFAVSSNYAYRLSVKSGGVVHCDQKWPLNGATAGDKTHPVFYGLAVGPKGTVSANETLIAANSAGQLYQIDQTTGATTPVGNFGVDSKSGLPWELSGDVVILSNGGSPIGFATVRTCSSPSKCSTTDTLIELNVGAIKPGNQSVLKSVRGQLKKGSWCTSSVSGATYDKMFGIAAFNDKVYGFSDNGVIVEINNNDATSCPISMNSKLSFKGAGVSTAVAVKAPTIN